MMNTLFRILFFTVMVLVVTACGKTVKTPIGDSGYVLLNKEGKEIYGVEDSDGWKILPVKYRDIHLYSVASPRFNYFHAVGDQKEYLFDAVGNEICCADQLQKCNGSDILWKLISKADGSVSFINLVYQTISEPYLDIKFAGNQFVVTSEFGEGIVSLTGESLVGAHYDAAYVVNTPGGWYYIVKDKGKERYRKFSQNGVEQHFVPPYTFEKIKKSAKPSEYETGWNTPKDYYSY